MKDFLLLLTALCAGGLLPIQGALNADLSKTLNHPVSFTRVLGCAGLLVSLYLVQKP